MKPRGLPVPEMMDRASTRPRQEITRGFIVHVASPFFETCVAPLFPPEHAAQLRANVVANQNALRSAAQPIDAGLLPLVPPRRGSYVVARDDAAPLANFSAPPDADDVELESSGHMSRRVSLLDRRASVSPIALDQRGSPSSASAGRIDRRASTGAERRSSTASASGGGGGAIDRRASTGVDRRSSIASSGRGIGLAVGVGGSSRCASNASSGLSSAATLDGAPPFDDDSPIHSDNDA
jgi:hypothetical protein